MKKELIKKIAVVAGALVFCGAMLMLYFVNVVPIKKSGVKSVVLEIAYSDKEFTYKNLSTETETVFELLREWNEELELGMKYSDSVYGPFIKELKGTADNVGEGYYYTFKINGESSNFGVSQAAIKDGDTVRFEYGYTTYGADYEFVSFELKPSTEGTDKGSTRTVRTNGQIAAIVVSAVVAALGIGVVLFFALKKDKNAQTDNM